MDLCFPVLHLLLQDLHIMAGTAVLRSIFAVLIHRVLISIICFVVLQRCFFLPVFQILRIIGQKHLSGLYCIAFLHLTYFYFGS